MEPIRSGNIAGCERVKLVTAEDAPRTFIIKTATGVSFQASVSAGEDAELRIKNTIYGALRTEDIVKGYDLSMDDPALNAEILALVDGGAVSNAGLDGETYAAPTVGTPVARTAFDLYVYSSDRDSDGEAVCYHEWKFPACKGSPIEGSLKDGEFTTLAYKIKSRPASGVSPLSVKRVSALPET